MEWECDGKIHWEESVQGTNQDAGQKKLYSRWKYSAEKKLLSPSRPPAFSTWEGSVWSTGKSSVWDGAEIQNPSSAVAAKLEHVKQPDPCLLLSPTTSGKQSWERRKRLFQSHQILISSILLLVPEKNINIFRCQKFLKDIAVGHEHHLLQCERWPLL